MKFTNIELLNMNNILSQFSDRKFPQKISFAITKNLILLGNELASYNKEVEKLFKRYKNYCEKDENGEIKYNTNGLPLVDEQHRDEFISELNELLNISTEINLYCISEELFDYDDSNGRYDSMSPKEMVEIQSVICERNK